MRNMKRGEVKWKKSEQYGRHELDREDDVRRCTRELKKQFRRPKFGLIWFEFDIKLVSSGVCLIFCRDTVLILKLSYRIICGRRVDCPKECFA